MSKKALTSGKLNGTKKPTPKQELKLLDGLIKFVGGKKK